MGGIANMPAMAPVRNAQLPLTRRPGVLLLMTEIKVRDQFVFARPLAET